MERKKKMSRSKSLNHFQMLLERDAATVLGTFSAAFRRLFVEYMSAIFNVSYLGVRLLPVG